MVSKERDEHYARCVETVLEMKAKQEENATVLFERRQKFHTLEEIEAALTKGIYGE